LFYGFPGASFPVTLESNTDACISGKTVKNEQDTVQCTVSHCLLRCRA